MPLANELALISRYDHPVVDLDGDASQGPAPPRRGKGRGAAGLGARSGMLHARAGANLLRTFLSEEKAAAYAGEVWTRVRLLGGPAACRRLGDSAAWVGLTSAHPGARRTGFRHPVGRG